MDYVLNNWSSIGANICLCAIGLIVVVAIVRRTKVKFTVTENYVTDELPEDCPCDTFGARLRNVESTLDNILPQLHNIVERTAVLENKHLARLHDIGNEIEQLRQDVGV